MVTDFKLNNKEHFQNLFHHEPCSCLLVGVIPRFLKAETSRHSCQPAYRLIV